MAAGGWHADWTRLVLFRSWFLCRGSRASGAPSSSVTVTVGSTGVRMALFPLVVVEGRLQAFDACGLSWTDLLPRVLLVHKHFVGIWLVVLWADPVPRLVLG